MPIDRAELERRIARAKNAPLLTSATVARSAANLPLEDGENRYWQFAGPNDADTSALCRWLLGKVFDRTNPDDQRWLPPVHINCRHHAAPVEAPDGRPVFQGEEVLRREIKRAGADPEKVLKEGHFVFQPGKYVELKFPARPEGRDFIVRRRKNPQTGTLETILDWVRREGIAPDLTPEEKARQKSLLERALEAGARLRETQA